MSLFDRLIVRTLPFVPKPIVRRTSARYIAGETLDDALRAASELYQGGFLATLDLLGEDTFSLEGARRAAADYGMVLETLYTRGVAANLSIKPTQFGLKLDPDLCLELFRELARKARAAGYFVRVEMEDSSVTDATLALFRSLRREFTNVGIVIQSCLRRSPADVRAILDLQANVRLVKGVYVEPYHIAYEDPEIIRKQYAHLAQRLLRSGAYVAFATHDEQLVWEALRLIDELQLTPSEYEFQMLLGVEERLRDVIRDSGHPVRIYIPFGADWYRYSLRRLRENPKIAGYVVRSMFR